MNSEDIPPVSEDGEEALPIDSPIAYQTKYDQEYDKKGYPQNATSRKLKKQWRNAVNDVLATVGFCVAEGRPGSKASFSAADHQKVEDVAFENSLGIFVSAADWGLWRLSTYWPRALRQRIQVCMTCNWRENIEANPCQGLPFLQSDFHSACHQDRVEEFGAIWVFPGG